MTIMNTDLLRGLPQDLTLLTAEQDEAVVAYFASLDLRDLRERQAITRHQQGVAFAQQNRRAARNLQVTDDQLTRAVMRKTVG